MEEWREKGMEFLRQNKWIGVILVVGMLLFLGGRVVSFVSEDKEVEIISSNQGLERSGQSGKVWVDVEGAVMEPGVYELQSGARIKDALLVAGGLNEEADRNRISREMNLAAEVKDGSKIYFVREGEQGVPGVASASTGGSSGGAVNINTATASQLDKLWGIGPARAEQIISGRPYGSIEELKSKGSVPENVFERIREQVSL